MSVARSRPAGWQLSGVRQEHRLPKQGEPAVSTRKKSSEVRDARRTDPKEPRSLVGAVPRWRAQAIDAVARAATHRTCASATRQRFGRKPGASKPGRGTRPRTARAQRTARGSTPRRQPPRCAQRPPPARGVPCPRRIGRRSTRPWMLDHRALPSAHDSSTTATIAGSAPLVAASRSA